MSMTSPPRDAVRPRLRIAIAGPASIVIGAALAIAADAAIAAVAYATGVPERFSPLHPSSYIALTIVVVLSLIPDVALGATKAGTATTWGGVFALIIMHLAVATIAVTTFAVLMPIRRQDMT